MALKVMDALAASDDLAASPKTRLKPFAVRFVKKANAHGSIVVRPTITERV